MRKLESDAWPGARVIKQQTFVCGHCGMLVTSNKGLEYHYTNGRTAVTGPSCPICPSCGRTSFMDGSEQVPPAPRGRAIKHLPADVERIYNEARACFVSSAYAGSALVARTLVMHIAVERGAKQGMTFQQYVQYMLDEGILPKSGAVWFDHVRLTGNAATHELPPISMEDAGRTLDLLEGLLVMVYEFPGAVS